MNYAFICAIISWLPIGACCMQDAIVQGQCIEQQKQEWQKERLILLARINFLEKALEAQKQPATDLASDDDDVIGFSWLEIASMNW